MAKPRINSLIDPLLKSLYPYKKHSSCETLIVSNVKDSKAIAVKILSKEFQVTCPAGTEEQLHEAAFYLDQKMKEIRRNGRVIGLERIAMMAALNISHELLSFRQQKEADAQTVNKRIQRLQNKIDTALMVDTTSKNEKN